MVGTLPIDGFSSVGLVGAAEQLEELYSSYSYSTGEDSNDAKVVRADGSRLDLVTAECECPCPYPYSHSHSHSHLRALPRCNTTK